MKVTVGADSPDVAVSLSSALEQRGAEIGFLVDCDTGFGRTGVQSPGAAASSRSWSTGCRLCTSPA